MSEDLEIITGETSDRVKLSHLPYLSLRLDGSSYLNKRAAALLDVKHGDTVRFLYRKDFSEFWICLDPDSGAVVSKSGGLYKFCDLKNIRLLFSSLSMPAKRAFFPLASEVEVKLGMPALFIIPKPCNVL